MIHISIKFLLSAVLATAALSINCSAQVSEEQALANLRQMTADGKLPPEGVVADIESRFAGKRTGALAKLLHARIKFENQDYAGAAALLNSDVFKTKTKVGDYALWLRGKALQGQGNHAEAMNVFKTLFDQFPESIRVRDAKLLWAQSAIAAGRAIDVPPMLVQFSENRDQDALLLTAKAYQTQNSRDEAIKYYRLANFANPWSPAATEAVTRLKVMGVEIKDKLPSGDEQLVLAEAAFNARKYAEAAIAYRDLFETSPAMATPANRVKQIISLANSGSAAYIRQAFDAIPADAKEREEGYRQLVLGYAKAKMWPQAHRPRTR